MPLDTTFTVVLYALWTFLWWVDYTRPVSYILPLYCLVFWSVLAIGYVLTGASLGEWFIDAFWWGMFAWLCWKRRPPRRRKSSKILSKVRVVGHRLRVVPT